MGINQYCVLYAACQNRRGGHQPAYGWLSLPKKACGFLRKTGQHSIVPLGIDEGRCGSSTLGLTCLKSQEKIRGYESPLKLLFAVSVVPNKGLHLLIEAMGQLYTQLVVLDVLGNAAVSCGYQSGSKRA
jgi:hypothetical protein